MGNPQQAGSSEPLAKEAPIQMEAFPLQSRIWQPFASLDTALVAINEYLTLQGESVFTACLTKENNHMESRGIPPSRREERTWTQMRTDSITRVPGCMTGT